jgi:hypothetical protein
MSANDYQALLRRLVDGEIATSELPVRDEQFWLSAFTASTRSGWPRHDSRVRAAATSLLQRPIEQDADLARRRAAISALSSTDSHVRLAAVRWAHDAEVDDELLDRVARLVSDEQIAVGLEALRLLAKHASPRNVPALIEALGTSDVREYLAGEALVAIGAPAVEELTALLAHDDVEVRARAAHWLSRMRCVDALPGLIQALHDDSPEVAWPAADGLVAFGPTAQEEVLRSMLARPLSPVTLQAFRHYAEHSRPEAVFRPLVDAASGPAEGAATLPAVENALVAIRTHSNRTGD